MNIDIELLPCPFCGSDDITGMPVEGADSYAHCESCLATHTSVSEWNTRAALTAPQQTKQEADSEARKCFQEQVTYGSSAMLIDENSVRHVPINELRQGPVADGWKQFRYVLATLISWHRQGAGLFPQTAEEHRDDIAAIRHVLTDIDYYEGRQECPTCAPSPRPAAPALSDEERFTYLDTAALAALFRLEECCSDPESGGHDLAKYDIRRLCDLGAVNSKGFGKYEITAFGNYVIEYEFSQNPKLPLKTTAEHNASADRALLAKAENK